MNNDVSPSQNSTTITTPIEIPDSEPPHSDDDIQIISSQDKCINLDDDSDVIIEENNPVIIDIDSDDLEIIESNNTPIVIEDEDQNCVINPLNYIKQKQDQLFDTVCQENSLLAQVIEDAMNLDTSGSMKRIIQRTLIPLYLSCNVTYKQSEAFQNYLKRTTILLETAPHLKYSHIKSLCELLKHVKVQKALRVRKHTSESTPKKRKHKKRKNDSTNVIQTREKEKKDNTESTTSKANTSKDTLIEMEIQDITSISPSSNKENIVIEIKETTNDKLNNNSNNTSSTDTAHNNFDNNTQVDPNNLLRPHYAINTKTPPEPAQHTVESLEKQIAHLKTNLERIEEQEVTDDNMTSPYLIAETLKSQIVQLYKQLCDLMGVENTKRHEVKLQVVNGHPPGPARCLEEYINDNIDEYGNPPFPDIFEVVRCVERAVEEDRLIWNRKRIVAEAQVLLKHYGHAIQKRRKKREWRDMVSRCKEELVDPADLDPALEAKLLENSRIAKKNEDEIIDRYARLEKENSTNPAFRLSLETAADDSGSDNEDIHNNMAVKNNIQEAPSLTMADSTNITKNKQVCPNFVNSNNIQGNLSITNSDSNIQGALNIINSRHILSTRTQCSSNIVSSINNIQSGSNIIKGTNIVESNVRNGSSLINPDLTTNLQNCEILIVNSELPNLQGSICFINSTPVLAARIQGGPSFINSTNVEGNLQNALNIVGNLQSESNLVKPNNLAANLQNGPNFINSNHSAEKAQNGPNFINNLACNLQSGNKFINSNNLADNLQNEPGSINSSNIIAGNLQSKNNYLNSNNLADNLQNEPGFINSSNDKAGNLQSKNNYLNSNNLADNLQNEPGSINSSNIIADNLQNQPSFINSSNDKAGNLQNEPGSIHSSNIIADNLQSQNNFINPNTSAGSNSLECHQENGSNNKEDNLELHSSPTDYKTKEIQSMLTNIGNIEYNRTIMIDSTGSDTDNEKKEHTDIVTYTNTVKERDKSDVDEIENKIKVKQEEDDIMTLLSELGSDCVGTVFDIEDPFLVIEISDSSDEEE